MPLDTPAFSRPTVAAASAARPVGVSSQSLTTAAASSPAMYRPSWADIAASPEQPPPPPIDGPTDPAVPALPGAAVQPPRQASESVPVFYLPPYLDWSRHLFVLCSRASSPIYPMDVVTAIGSIIPRRHITSLGNFRSATVYLVEIDGSAAHAALLAAPELRVNGHSASVVPATPGQLTLILRRLPQSVPDQYVEMALRPWCTIIRQHRLRFDDPGLTGVVTDRRQVLVTLRHGITTDSVPTTLRVADLDVNVDVMGRPTRCFRCHQLGHTRAGCPVPDCTICTRPDLRGHRCAPLRRSHPVPIVQPSPLAAPPPDMAGRAAPPAAVPSVPDAGVSVPPPVIAGPSSVTTTAAPNSSPSLVPPPPGFTVGATRDDARGARSRGTRSSIVSPAVVASRSDDSLSPPRSRVRTRSSRRRSRIPDPAAMTDPPNPNCAMDCTRPISPVRDPTLGPHGTGVSNPFDVLSGLRDPNSDDGDPSADLCSPPDSGTR